MTHQQKSTSTTRNKDKNGKNKQNNFRLSLPGKFNIYEIIFNRITQQITTGMGILRKFQQYRRLPQDPPPGPPHHLEEELDRLTGKIVRISPLPLSWRSPGHLLLSGQPPVQDRGSGPGGGPGPRGGVRGVRHQQSQHADPALQPPGKQGGIF